MDTAVLFPRQNASNACMSYLCIHFAPIGPQFKNSLKFLAQKYLQKHIQHSEHDSVTDATVVMELVKLKIEKDILSSYFSYNILSPSFGEILEEDTETLFEVLSECNRKSAIIDRFSIARQYSSGDTSSIPCNSDEEVFFFIFTLRLK